jgi:hypothetical protein
MRNIERGFVGHIASFNVGVNETNGMSIGGVDSA